LSLWYASLPLAVDRPLTSAIPRLAFRSAGRLSMQPSKVSQTGPGRDVRYPGVMAWRDGEGRERKPGRQAPQAPQDAHRLSFSARSLLLPLA
jgi:hypothetical protein